MRVAFVHSFYGHGPSGENQVVLDQFDALASAGHDVKLFARYTDVLATSPWFKTRAGLRLFTSVGRSLRKEIESFSPDIVHLHNLFPNFPTVWARGLRIPVVQTLHNYRLVCASGDLLRGGTHCELCPSYGSHHAVLNRCYRNSRTASIPLALSTMPWQQQRYLARRRALIFPSEAARETISRLMTETGAPRQFVVPNFIGPDFVQRPARFNQSSPSLERYWVFSGRLEKAKGIHELIENWPSHEKLVILGSGSLEPELKKTGRGKCLDFRGNLRRDDVLSVLQNAFGLVFSSLAMETAASMSYLEAISLGKPVLALEGSVVANDVVAGKTGAVFQDFSDLSGPMKSIEKNYEALSKNCLRRTESEFSVSNWLDRITHVYAEVLASES